MATPRITNISGPYGHLIATLEAASDDVVKVNKGNHAAAVRVRKVMLDVKQQAQDIRVALVAPK